MNETVSIALLIAFSSTVTLVGQRTVHSPTFQNQPETFSLFGQPLYRPEFPATVKAQRMLNL
jgi:hypothetical protein